MKNIFKTKQFDKTIEGEDSKFEPANAKNYVSKSLVTFTSFIDECFTPEGTYKEDGYYPKVPGKSKKNCKYCTHYKTNCDGKETKDDKEDN